MKSFSYLSAPDVGTALRTIADSDDVKFLAGGTNLVDLMREGIEHPATVVDITRLPLTGIEELPEGGIRVGALLSNNRLAADPLIRTRYPVLAQAILHGASAQLRNMATVGGNLLQRTRCMFSVAVIERSSISQKGRITRRSMPVAIRRGASA
ncbi:FAD binding domain-containing protein [Streptomyces sp. NPDC049687]|uniref:FAD binding domain-containing protein n=1 Tax=Streptomyces sp. NPDC049687 TaxID=3365596 RepID=UPI0037A3E504